LTAVATAAYCFQPGLRLPPGLFIDQWMSFAVGLAVFGWFDARYGRLWSLSIFGLSIVAEAVTWRLDLAVSVAAAVSFVALRKYDGYLSSLRPVAMLASVGAISYSLYLTHVPIVGRIVNGSLRFVGDPGSWWPLIALSAGAAAIGAAAVFYMLVEKRFQNSRSTARGTAVPTVAAA
jgi:peptidoglycan/LPS O-acetylase OafA/YrhL